MSQPVVWPLLNNAWETLLSRCEGRTDQPVVVRVGPSDTWNDLINGRTKVVATFNTADRAYLATTAAVSEAASKAPPDRNIAILVSVLLGNAHKIAAFKTRLSVSSVSGIAQQCLGFMGVRCRPSRAPMSLLLLAHAASSGGGGGLHAASRNVTYDGRSYRLTLIERPDQGLEAQVTNAEAAVLRLLLEGRTHREISKARGRSERTIANQLASAFSVLGVSGRGELLSKLVATRTTEHRQRAQLVDSTASDPDRYANPRLLSDTARSNKLNEHSTGRTNDHVWQDNELLNGIQVRDPKDHQ